MPVVHPDLLAETRRATQFFNALALVVGGVLVTLAVLKADEDWLVTTLSLVGGALVSAAVVSFVFGSITIRDTTRQVDRAVTHALEDVLAPIRASLYATALGDYRWDCFIDDTRGERETIDQTLRISYRLSELPEELRMICVATTRDEVLAPFIADPRYVFRWLIENELDPSAEEIFRVTEVLVDGQSVVDRKRTPTAVSGTPALEYRFPIVASLRTGGDHTIEFAVFVRKRVGQDRQIRIQTHLFKLVTNAEFRLGVGRGIGATKVEPSTAQVAAVSPARGVVCGPTFPDGYEHAAAIVKIPYPIQAGSSIVFRIDR